MNARTSQPKRHHWWPMVQSRHWTDSRGLVFITRADGSTFRATPLNVGVESELYTRFDEDGGKDTLIEQWFAETIDSPASKMIEHLLDRSNRTSQPIAANREKSKTVKALGFGIGSRIEKIALPSEIRRAISEYLAALLVRHPLYLQKLIRFHSAVGSDSSDAIIKGKALDSMVRFFELYVAKIETAVFLVSERRGSAEYLYADGGIIVDEPWRKAYGVPFDIHAPITPDIAIQVLPIPGATDLQDAAVMPANNRGVARQNRIILAGARRFVFSRDEPPTKFIHRNFGLEAPKDIGYRIINGRLDTSYNP